MPWWSRLRRWLGGAPAARGRADIWHAGEDAAARYLRRQRFKILARNVRLGRNELDIIARDGDTIVFVEVRTRASADPYRPEDSITPRKQRHLRTAAAWYMARNPDPESYYRFDVVAVILPEDGPPEITHYRDAFPG